MNDTDRMIFACVMWTANICSFANFAIFAGVILGDWVMETLVTCLLLSQSKHYKA